MAPRDEASRCRRVSLSLSLVAEELGYTVDESIAPTIKRRSVERDRVLPRTRRSEKIRDKSVVMPQRDEDLSTLHVLVLLIPRRSAAIILIVGD